MKTIGLEHLEDLTSGSVFLATGGGGDPYVPLLIAREAIKQYGPVTVLHPDVLDDDACIVTIGGVGAPTVSLELLPSVDDAAQTLDAFEKAVGRKVDAVVSFEIGGGNSLVPLVAATIKGIPVIDGDGMGRALPEAQMMSYAIAGVSPTPALAYDYAGNTALFEVGTTEVYERQIRAYCMAAGGMVTTAEHPMSGAELKRSIIPGTLSFSQELGRVLRENRGQADKLLEPLQKAFKPSIYGECRLIFTGKVIDKRTQILGGFDVGEACLQRFDGSGEPLIVSIKNEFLLAKIGDTVVASVPDLITIVDFETGVPINAERLRYGQRVSVFAIGCPQFYRSEAALKVVAPRCFGFDEPYIPLEDIKPV